MSPSTKQAFANSTAARKRKRPAPFSIRLSEDERAYLEGKAGNKPLGTYAREKLLGDAQAPRKPVKRQRMDYELLGRVLAELGRSELSSCLCILAMAAENGSLDVSDDVTKNLNLACADVRDMRVMLIQALGLRPGVSK